MSIGLYDLDMLTYHQVPLNLELAKLSSYYKRKREIVAMSPSFQPSRYGKFIIRKDYEDGIYPKNISKFNNIEYGGYSFSNGLYIPLPLEIEVQKPDTALYARFQNLFSINKRYETAFKVMLNANHFRLSLNGTDIWEIYHRQLPNSLNRAHILFCHDKNIQNIDGAYEELMKLSKKCGASSNFGTFGMKFPVMVYNEKELIKWSHLKSSQDYFSIQYNGIMDDEAMVHLVRDCRGRTFLKKLDYYVTNGFNSQEEFIEKGLQKIYRQIIYLRMHRVKVSLKYEENFFLDPQWGRVLQLFECFAATAQTLQEFRFRQVMKYDSLYSFVHSFKEEPMFTKYPFGKVEARKLFQLVRENNYDAFDDFYNCHLVKIEKGEFIPCETWT